MSDPCALKCVLWDIKFVLWWRDIERLYTGQLGYMSIQSTSGKLPGFHSSSKISDVVKIATMLKENAIRYVLPACYKWIGNMGVQKDRQEEWTHRKVCNDDTITCLAMGMFVMEYSINKQLELKTTIFQCCKRSRHQEVEQQQYTKWKSPSMFYELPSKEVMKETMITNPFLWLFTKRTNKYYFYKKDKSCLNKIKIKVYFRDINNAIKTIRGKTRIHLVELTDLNHIN